MSQFDIERRPVTRLNRLMRIKHLDITLSETTKPSKLAYSLCSFAYHMPLQPAPMEIGPRMQNDARMTDVAQTFFFEPHRWCGLTGLNPTCSFISRITDLLMLVPMVCKLRYVRLRLTRAPFKSDSIRYLQSINLYKYPSQIRLTCHTTDRAHLSKLLHVQFHISGPFVVVTNGYTTWVPTTLSKQQILTPYSADFLG